MPVRSIKLKIYAGSGDAGRATRQALWTTHAVVNQAAARFEQVLLLCRGRSYWNGDEELVPTERVQLEALAFAREVQQRNGAPGAGSDSEVLAALREWYIAIVPSAELDEKGKPLKGDAQASNAFAGPMMDQASEGFQNVFGKVLEPLPTWVEMMQSNRTGWEEVSRHWLESEQAQMLLRATGSPPGWVRKLRKGEGWQQGFVDDQQKKRAQTTGLPLLIRRMKQDLGLLPMLAPPITSRLAESGSALTPWDRLALRLAVAHLLSWESWSHRAMGERQRVLEQVERCRVEAENYDEIIAELRTYEKTRHEELKRVALADDASPYKIGLRAIRGWTRVREVWEGSKRTSQSSRLSALAALQTEMRGRFGDPELFRWLAIDGREQLWQNADALPALAKLNALEGLLARKKDAAIWTAPDSQAHPRWAMYEAPGGSNLKNYRIEICSDSIAIRIPLLKTNGQGLAEETFEVRLAKSSQFSAPSWVKGRERELIEFTSSHQRFRAELRGAEILFARHQLENRRAAELDEGQTGPVWFKLVLDLESKANPEWLDNRGRVATPDAVHHFNTGLANKSKYADSLSPGLRVLSVDLGLRTFASCTVFELVEGRPGNGLAFLADAERDLWARHERSFHLAMEGERVPRSVTEARRAAFDDTGALRRDLRRLKDLLRLSVKESPEDRAAGIAELRGSLREEAEYNREPSLAAPDLAPADEAIHAPPALWSGTLLAIHRQAERALGLKIGEWRRRTRARAAERRSRRQWRPYAGGKSTWAMEYLEGVRRLLLGWSLHGRQFGSIRRQDRQKRGVFAVRLLEHINALKKDRTKVGSDLIIQAARGFVPGQRKGWVKRYEPCRVVLFEDLARYRFRTDRPRRENSQLMRWSHRQLLQEAAMQAELYGIVLATTGAGFSSRFHARSGAPGCRVRLLEADDFASPVLVERLEGLAQRLGIDVSLLQQGMRVPWEGGEEFATLKADGSVLLLDADINAAQNLQRRFWTRHGDAYRLSAIEIRRAGQEVWYPENDGVRQRGALSQLVGGDGYARLVPAGDSDGFVLEKVAKRDWSRATGGQSSGDEEGFDEVEAELAMAGDSEEMERSGGRAVFFRDPSGLVLRADRWYEGKEFWGRVQRRISTALGLSSGRGAGQD